MKEKDQLRNYRESGFNKLDRGQEGFCLPALRTVRAVLPHTALQSLVSSSGLARYPSGFFHGEKSELCEEEIRPTPMVIKISPESGSFLLFS